MLTANGLPVTALRLSKPPQGVWVASLEVTSDERVLGAVELKQDGLATAFLGTARFSGEPVAGSCRIEVVGGTGGFATKTVEAKSYAGISARSIISDLLAALGESLSPTSAKAVLNATLPYWTRAAGKAGEGKAILSTLTAALGAIWRVLPDGSVWVGTETWPTLEDFEAVEMNRDEAASAVVLAPETIGLLPGVTYTGRKVGRVEDSFGRTAPLRTTFWFEE